MGGRSDDFLMPPLDFRRSLFFLFGNWWSHPGHCSDDWTVWTDGLMWFTIAVGWWNWFPYAPCTEYMPTLSPFQPPQCMHIFHTWSIWDWTLDPNPAISIGCRCDSSPNPVQSRKKPELFAWTGAVLERTTDLWLDRSIWLSLDSPEARWLVT